MCRRHRGKRMASENERNEGGLSAGILFGKTMWKETVSAAICQWHQH